MASIIKKKLLKENINTIIVKGYPYRDKREKFYYNKVKILNYWYNLVVCKDILNLRYNTLPFVFLVDDKTINRHFNIEYIKNGVDNFSYMYISKYNFEDILKNNLIINKKYGKVNIYIKILISAFKRKIYPYTLKKINSKKEIELHEKDILENRFSIYSNENLDNSKVLSLNEFLETKNKELDEIDYASLVIGYYNNEYANEILKDRKKLNKLLKYKDKILDIVLQFENINKYDKTIFKDLKFDNIGRRIPLKIYFQNTNLTERNIENFEEGYNNILKKVKSIKNTLKNINVDEYIVKNFTKLNKKDIMYLNNIMGKDMIKFIYFIEVLRYIYQNSIKDFSITEARKKTKKWVNNIYTNIEREHESIYKIIDGLMICESYTNILLSFCTLLDIKALPVFLKKYTIGHIWVKVNFNNNWYNIDLNEDAINVWELEDLTSILKSDKYYKENLNLESDNYIDVRANIDFDEEILNKCIYYKKMFNLEIDKKLYNLIDISKKYKKTNPIKLYNECYI